MSMGYLEPLVNSFHAMFKWSRDHGRLFVSEQNDHKISKYLSRDWREESKRSITIYPSFPMSPYNERKYYQTSKDHRNRNFPVTKRSTPLLLQNLSAFSPYPSWKAHSLTSSIHCLDAAWIFLLIPQAFYRARERSLDVDFSWEAVAWWRFVFLYLI